MIYLTLSRNSAFSGSNFFFNLYKWQEGEKKSIKKYRRRKEKSVREKNFLYSEILHSPVYKLNRMKNKFKRAAYGPLIYCPFFSSFYILTSIFSFDIN